MTKQIPLTQGKVALVDDEDFERVHGFKWRLWKSALGKPYAKGWIKVKGKWITVSMHRFILNAQIGQQVDHKDGDGLNNTRSNIRFCTASQNDFNRTKYRVNKSGYKGVSRPFTNHKKWGAHIRVNGRLKHLGFFNSAEDAARAYDKAARELHGEFANTNF